MKTWNIEGYKPITTFYEDFSIADLFGPAAIRDTYNRAFKEWKSDYKYLTELVMVLNWKIWEYYEIDDEYSNLYNELWAEADDYAVYHLEGTELNYFYNITD